MVVDWNELMRAGLRARLSDVQAMYHVAPTDVRQEIQAGGLAHQGHDQYPGDVLDGGNPQAVYLWHDLPTAEQWRQRCIEEDAELEHEGEGYDIYEVDVSGLPLEQDRVSDYSSAYAGTIGPERLRLHTPGD